jgi:hypothetical protein
MGESFIEFCTSIKKEVAWAFNTQYIYRISAQIVKIQKGYVELWDSIKKEFVRSVEKLI